MKRQSYVIISTEDTNTINVLLHDIKILLSNIEENYTTNRIKSRLNEIEFIINDDGVKED